MSRGYEEQRDGGKPGTVTDLSRLLTSQTGTTLTASNATVRGMTRVHSHLPHGLQAAGLQHGTRIKVRQPGPGEQQHRNRQRRIAADGQEHSTGRSQISEEHHDAPPGLCSSARTSRPHSKPVIRP